MDTDPTTAEVIESYESGKDRRYALLFAVNGGAFAVIQLLAPEQAGVAGGVSGGPTAAPALVGALQPWHVGLGMAVFTTLMVADIDAFGRKMRTKGEERGHKLYGLIGVVVLMAVGSLVVTGWTLASLSRSCRGWAEAAAVAAGAAHFLMARYGFRWIDRQWGDAGETAVTGSPGGP